ncbi:MAG: amidophosphoribosyltransferase [Methanobacteriota archaeon]
MSGNVPDFESGDDSPKDSCGVIGIVSDKAVSQDIFFGLRIIQHRGQESAGIATFGGVTHSHKGMGLAHEVFNKELLDGLKGTSGIGHVRYSTTGSSKAANAQPIIVTTSAGDVALAHNGDLVNSAALRDDLQKKGWAFISTTDSEIIIRLLANELTQNPDVTKAAKALMNSICGSYSLVFMVNGRVYALRDPLAIRPLSLGKVPGGYAVASESVVFEALGGDLIRDVEPGEVVEISLDGFKSIKASAPKRHAHCMFEWVYFARPDSILEGTLVYDVRYDIGATLAREHPIEADMVVPVPDSGRAHALGFANTSGLPYFEGLIKNRYIERTFIMPEQSDRENTVHLKMHPIRKYVAGKRVVLVDDSIVRGTTMRKIVQILKKAGASEVHVRIGCPPIVSPCYLGIDMKSRGQFVATGRSLEQIAEQITADSVGYLSMKGLITAINHPAEDLCLGCLTGEYPVEVPGERVRFQRSLKSFS